LANWLAETRASILDPGTAVHFSSATTDAPAAGDTVALDGPALEATAGRVASVDDRQMILELSTGARFAFRHRREDEKPSGLSTGTGTDWILLLVSPGELRDGGNAQ
jgi:hypothetical protein